MMLASFQGPSKKEFPTLWEEPENKATLMQVALIRLLAKRATSRTCPHSLWKEAYHTVARKAHLILKASYLLWGICPTPLQKRSSGAHKMQRLNSRLHVRFAGKLVEYSKTWPPAPLLRTVKPCVMQDIRVCSMDRLYTVLPHIKLTCDVTCKCLTQMGPECDPTSPELSVNLKAGVLC